MNQLFVLFFLIVLPKLTLTQSWLTCPPSFNPMIVRSGETVGPCDGDIKNAPITKLKAGDRLKVGWPSLNRGGGFVRLSLVPASLSTSQSAFDRNVLKQTCFGRDARLFRYAYGNCIHPCNGRPGCSWPRNTSDVERYDTSITIPYNLQDGEYVLQFLAITGNAPSRQFSCSRLEITGGNSSLSCLKPASIPQTNCTAAFGPSLTTIMNRTEAGSFCYSQDGKATIDTAIDKMPVNADCDPRLSCESSFNKNLCRVELRSTLVPSNPKLTCYAPPTLPRNCRLTNLNSRPSELCNKFQSSCESVCNQQKLKITGNYCYNRPDNQPLPILPFCSCDTKNTTSSAIQSAVNALCSEISVRPTITTRTSISITRSTTRVTSSSIIRGTPSAKSSRTTAATRSTLASTGSPTPTLLLTTKALQSTLTPATTAAPASRTSTSIMTPRSTCLPKIRAGSACSSSKNSSICSERQIAVCLKNKWRIRSCSSGSCHMVNGRPVCDKNRKACRRSKRSFDDLWDLGSYFSFDF